jgi:hypothetical protein
MAHHLLPRLAAVAVVAAELLLLDQQARPQLTVVTVAQELLLLFLDFPPLTLAVAVVVHKQVALLARAAQEAGVMVVQQVHHLRVQLVQLTLVAVAAVRA